VRPSRKDDLVECAARVFAREGFHATGIDRLLSEAGVAKMTLYNHFGGKDELIAAALERSSEASMAFLESKLCGEGAERLLSFFDALGSWYASKDFHGCVLLNAAAEYKDPEHPVREKVRAHTDRQLALLRELAAGAGAADPDALAEELMLLVQGSIEAASVGCVDRSAAAAKRAARALVEHAARG